MSEKKKHTKTDEKAEERAEEKAEETTEAKAETGGSEPETQPEQKTEQKPESEKLLDEYKRLADDYKDKWYRTAAEFENFKKRNAETRRTAYEEGKADIIKKILFIGDNVERALSYEIDEKTKEGLSMLLRQYDEIMAGLGLEVINPVGEPFDPNFHEAVFSRDAKEGEQSGTVESVFLKGYKLGGKIIRYAQVVVIK